MTIASDAPTLTTEISGTHHLSRLADVFRLLSDRTRLNLLLILSRGERNVTSLCEELRLPQPTVSHHLGLLRMSRLIVPRRDGKQVFYSLDAGASAAEESLLAFRAAGLTVRVADDGPAGGAAPTAATDGEPFRQVGGVEGDAVTA